MKNTTVARPTSPSEVAPRFSAPRPPLPAAFPFQPLPRPASASTSTATAPPLAAVPPPRPRPWSRLRRFGPRSASPPPASPSSGSLARACTIPALTAAGGPPPFVWTASSLGGGAVEGLKPCLQGSGGRPWPRPWTPPHGQAGGPGLCSRLSWMGCLDQYLLLGAGVLTDSHQHTASSPHCGQGRGREERREVGRRRVDHHAGGIPRAAASSFTTNVTNTIDAG